jgi:gamma-glutamyltranspeptidase/glutathione hydrolase
MKKNYNIFDNTIRRKDMKKKNSLPGILSIGLICFALILFDAGCCPCSRRSRQEPNLPSAKGRQPLVASFYKLSEQAGYRILKAGGNAFDAYVAVTMAENVLSSGYVTLCGLLSTLMYHAGKDDVLYLDSGFNSVLDPQGAFDPRNPVEGKKIVVPGLVAGLESISKRFGKLPFRDTLLPAIELARDGFVIDEFFSRCLAFDAEKLNKSDYARRTFFRDGKPLQPGDNLKQPELADFLINLADQGAGYMYRGKWAEFFVNLSRQRGGLMTMEDMAAYRPRWSEPWNMPYRNFDIYASAGRANLSLWVLLALKTLEHTDIQKLGHFSESPGALETMVRVARAVDGETWIHDIHILDNPELVNSRLTLNYSAAIWARANGVLENIKQQGPQTEQTLTSIIADERGNVICGKHSINSELWGDGLFVQGVLLNASGDITERFTGPGQRRIQGAPNFLIFKNRDLKYACGSWSSSNPQAAFQFLVNLLDYGLPADQAAGLPRFGSAPYDMKTWKVDSAKNWLDKRFSRELVETLKARGLYFSQQKPKLGKGCMVEFHPDGQATVGWDKID